jgi:hypothetical protein
MLRELQAELLELRQRTSDQPYSIIHRLKLAKAYRDLGYPDLAAGDAYKALILIDEVREEGEYHAEAVEAAVNDLKASSTSQHEHCCCCQDESKDAQTDEEAEVEAAERAKSCWSRTA